MEWSAVEAQTAKAIEELQAAQTTRLLIDLSPMQMIHSGLVAALVRIWKSVESPDKAVVVVSPNSIVTEVLKSAGLQKLFPVVDTPEDAADSLGVSKEALIVQRERRVVAMGALPSAILAVVAAIPLFTDFKPNIQLNLEKAAGLLGVFAAAMGVLSIARDEGKRRLFGVVAFLMSASLLVALYVRNNPVSFRSPWAPPERNFSSGDDEDETEESDSEEQDENDAEGDGEESTESSESEETGSDESESSEED